MLCTINLFWNWLFSWSVNSNTANLKKVVLWKSKIQITKYKEKVCHITHIWSPSQSIFILYFVFWNLDSVFSRDNLFWISCILWICKSLPPIIEFAMPLKFYRNLQQYLEKKQRYVCDPLGEIQLTASPCVQTHIFHPTLFISSKLNRLYSINW